MDCIVRDLRLNSKNVYTTSSPTLFAVVVHNTWLKKWLKNIEVDNSVNNIDFTLQPGESVPYPWKKVFIRVLNKKLSKVLPLPRYKLSEVNDSPLTFSQLLQYVSQNNQRNLWKESYKKYSQNIRSNKETAIVNLLEHDQLLTEVIMRLYGTNIIKLRPDGTGKFEVKELSRPVTKTYDTQNNLLAAMFTLESENNIFIVYRSHYENSLLDCLNFSPNIIDKTYARGLFVIYQLLYVLKAMGDRGLCLGSLDLRDIFLTEDLWLQVMPSITNNVYCLDPSLICEQSQGKQSNVQSQVVKSKNSLSDEEGCWRNNAVKLEKLCMLWVRGQLSNLDYLLHLNSLAGRSANDPQAHFMVPWVTDFSSRCGHNWRDLTKSKYRLNKGDRQLDMTYDVTGCSGQIPHHVTDALSDITCYVYLARRTPKETLCKYVRNKWVPAEYPASIQRMQEWTPDECIPEFYTDPSVFKSIHEDLPDLGIPTWATCVEDFITKHREALESSHVSENLHHWIDITFGYKLSGPAAIKAKNVCLSLVDQHMKTRRGTAVQLLAAPHPPRKLRPLPPAPPRLRWTTPRDTRKSVRDSSDDITDEEDESSSLPQHISRLTVPTQRIRRQKSSRARSLTKGQEEDVPYNEHRASSHSRHYRVQRSEYGQAVIYLPKEFNPASSIQTLETLDNFRTKCFFSKSDDKESSRSNVPALNLCPVEDKTVQKDTDDTAFTNHMFLASYDQGFLKKMSQDSQLESVLKERKSRMFNTRYTTDANVYKQFVTESRRQDMLVIGCLIVEIFLHNYIRPLRQNSGDFTERYKSCRAVLKYNFRSLPKCVSYIASLLLNVQPPSLSFKQELHLQEEPHKKIAVTDKGLPTPTATQLLQPLLMQHLIPFPQSFIILHSLLSTLHEYEVTSNELNIIYTYECDGVQCETYGNVDKTKLYFAQKIAEGKVQACITHLGVLLNLYTGLNDFDALDIFLQHYIQLLENKDTSVLAAWHLFDTIAKALGPAETRNKLLKYILNLYEDDDFVYEKSEKVTENDATSSAILASKQKFIKLYHNIFLLQLMVRLGLQCFLDNITQHLVEAVGGYKDVSYQTGALGHSCHSRSMANKKPRYSDESVKNVLTTTSDIFSPDTSCGSEQIVTPSIEKTMSDVSEYLKEKDGDNRSENELFHFENDKERNQSSSSRSKSPTGSVDSNTAVRDTLHTPSPSTEQVSPGNSRFYTNLTFKNADHFKEERDLVPEIRKALSPNIDTPKPMFTSYLQFVDDQRHPDSLESELLDIPESTEADHAIPVVKSLGDDRKEYNDSYKISDMSSESLIWLSHRLGPVLSCRYITRNLLKMLTLCYIGKENLASCEMEDKDEFDEISLVNSAVVGDRNAIKVIKCLTSIVAMYGEQLIIFQYLPHMGELIASCRRRLSAPLEGGVVACLQLLKYLLPYMADGKVMEQLQDTFLKSILQPALRLACTSRSSFPSGAAARCALTRKLLDALHALALRIGPEMTRKHLCVPALQRFFLAFDKATGKTDNWPKQEDPNTEKATDQDSEPKLEGFLEICRDGSTAEWAVRDGRVVRADLPELACTPPSLPDSHDAATLTAQEELLVVFDSELAYHAYTRFTKLVGTDAIERALKNSDTIRNLCQEYRLKHCISSPLHITQDKRVQSSFSDEPLKKYIDITPKQDLEHISNSNSFGSNVTLVGNRIDVASDVSYVPRVGFDIVAYKGDGCRSDRHLRGDWLIYWEHEIGRADKEARFNLKQIKLQSFSGHTHSVKSIHCLDNENSFMSGSKDKTVRLWSLRNMGDGNAITQCNWTYTGHKKGVLSLAFLESLRLAVSTDSVVHIWDPFMESVVCQLDHLKSPVSIVRTLPGPSSVIVAATTDASIRLIDARSPSHNHELKLPSNTSTFIRCMCVSGAGGWVAVGLAGGQVAILEPRTGLPRAHWRAHDGEVLRLAAVDEHRLLSSGLDQVTALWKVEDGELITHLKGITEPAHCLSVYYNELISGTTNNRIGVHTSLDQDASFSSTKLRSDSFKGVLTCMSVLPLNRLLLLGSDNGNISLLC
ncbi:WD repeat-containing protein 81 isoform X1 [Pieris napi]|uniref:WD repeat-containing protein 81 isoform X1 n=1 Tax=Pieris napi TaxID=78633 RepID=UPI001FB87E38|nr:WD repeat-containing protein 81 isoform X1 [Pieris napi]